MIENLSGVQVWWTTPAQNHRPCYVLHLFSVVAGGHYRTEFAWPWDVVPTEEEKIRVLQETMSTHLAYVVKRLKDTTNENPS